VKKRLATILFHSLGWKTVGDVPPHIKKYVIVAGPHTSNWDFFFGVLYFIMKDIPMNFLIKKDWYFFPFNIILNALGGIPVNRKKKENRTDEIAESFNKFDRLALLITPEGTRSYSPKWKKGFYYIAEKANVPIILGYIDYEKKIGGIGPVFQPTGNIDEDIKEIKSFYFDKKGKNPKNGIKPVN